MARNECRIAADEEREFIAETMQTLRTSTLEQYAICIVESHKSMFDESIAAIKTHGLDVTMQATIRMDAKVALLILSCARHVVLSEMAKRLEDSEDSDGEVES